MTTAPDTLKQGATLAARSATGPLIVNRYDGDDGAINWQLQQEGCTAENEETGAEVICGISDRDWKKARATAEFFAWCAAHGAEMIAEVERLRARVAILEDQAHDRRQDDIERGEREP